MQKIANVFGFLDECRLLYTLYGCWAICSAAFVRSLLFFVRESAVFFVRSLPLLKKSAILVLAFICFAKIIKTSRFVFFNIAA